MWVEAGSRATSALGRGVAKKMKVVRMLIPFVLVVGMTGACADIRLADERYQAERSTAAVATAVRNLDAKARACFDEAGPDGCAECEADVLAVYTLATPAVYGIDPADMTAVWREAWNELRTSLGPVFASLNEVRERCGYEWPARPPRPRSAGPIGSRSSANLGRGGRATTPGPATGPPGTEGT